MKLSQLALLKIFVVISFLCFKSQWLIAQCPTPIAQFNQALAFCGSGSFTVGGNTRTVINSGVYNDTLVGATISGCDSIVKTIVTVSSIPAPVAQLPNLVLCNGDTGNAIPLPVADTAYFAKWRTTQKGIGLHYIGLNQVPSFVAVNNTSQPIIDTISVVVKGKGYAWLPSGDRIYKINLTTYQIEDSAMVPNGKIIHNMVFSPDYSVLYAVGFKADGFERNIHAFSTYNGDLLRTYTVALTNGFNPDKEHHGNMCISPDGNYLYLNSQQTSNRFHLHKINTVTGAYTTIVRFGISQDPIYSPLTASIALSKDGSKLYLSRAHGGGGIEEMDANTLTHIRLLMPNDPNYYKMILSADGERIFVVNNQFDLGLIKVIDIASGLVVDTIPCFTNSTDNGKRSIGAIMYNADSSRIIALKGDERGTTQAVNQPLFVSEFDASTYAPLGVQDRFIGDGNVWGFDVLGSQNTFNPIYPRYANYSITPDGRAQFYTRMISEILNGTIRDYPAVSNNVKTFDQTPIFPNIGIHERNAGSIGQLVYPGYCESQVMRFTITVNPTIRDTQQVTICPGTFYTAGNNTYNTSGLYRDTIPNGSVYGCDSIIVTNLTVLPYPTFYQAFNFCGSGSVTVGNVTHTTSGYYTDTLKNASSLGCDSIVFTNLIINPLRPAPNVTVNNQTACNGAIVPATTLGNNLQWESSTTVIGLAASGTATVPAFTSINNGNTAIIDTISVTTAAPGFAYIANPNFSRVTVIDRQTNAVVTNITGLSGASGVAVNNTGSRVYVTGRNVNNLFVLNTTTNTLATTIPVGTQPNNVAVNPSGNRLYVANNGSNNISVIDTLTNSVVSTIPVGTNPLGIAVHPDGKRVYVANSGSDSVSVINTQTNTVIAAIPVGDNPSGLAINNAGNRVYVSNQIGGTVSVINAENNTVISTITVGNTPRGIAVTPDGTKVFVPNFLTNTVFVIDATTNTVITTLNVGNRPTGVSISADGTKAYVTNSTGGSVSVINTTTNAVIATTTGLSGPDTQGSYFTSGDGCNSTPVQYTITVNPTARKTQNITLCSGGSISVGTNTYNTSGTYIDTFNNASLNGCDSIVTSIVNVLAPITTTVNMAICQGSSFAGYTTSGTYIDLFTSVLGCDSTRTLNLTVNANPTAAITPTTASICNGASATLTASGGTSYAWSNSTTQQSIIVLPTINTTYNVTVTDAVGCSDTASVTVTVNQPSAFSFSNTICSNSSYVFNNQNLSVTGIYFDTLTNALGCDSIVTLNLNVNDLPVVSVSLNIETLCTNAGTLILSGGLPTGGNYSGSGVNNNVLDPSALLDGILEITYNYTDGNGCSNFAKDTIVVETCIGINNKVSKNIDVNLFPNPASNYVIVSSELFTDPRTTIMVHDVAGKAINLTINQTIATERIINTESITVGIYWVTVKNENYTTVKRFVKIN
jgi:YVTN family beta-propeller protein